MSLIMPGRDCCFFDPSLQDTRKIFGAVLPHFSFWRGLAFPPFWCGLAAHPFVARSCPPSFWLCVASVIYPLFVPPLSYRRLTSQRIHRIQRRPIECHRILFIQHIPMLSNEMPSTQPILRTAIIGRPRVNLLFGAKCRFSRNGNI